MSKQAYKFRLYPTHKQLECLQWTLDRTRELHNAALQERRDAYRMAGKHITYYDQANQLPEIKGIREEYNDIHSQVLQDVLRKADKAFKAFFARCKRGETPGYPRYKGRNQFASFTYPQGELSLGMIITSVSRKSGVSRSNCIERSRVGSKPAPSNVRMSVGMWCSPVRWNKSPWKSAKRQSALIWACYTLPHCQMEARWRTPATIARVKRN